MPLLADARALLEIDRERVRLARETAQIALEHSEVLADAEDRARRLADLGDQERPKTLQFLAEAATLLPSGPGAAGPAPAALSSSGGGGGGGAAGRSGGSGGTLTNSLLRSKGGTVQSRSWVEQKCTRTTTMIPRPGGMDASDLVEVAAWDCTVPFIELQLPVEDGAAIFIDPDSLRQYQRTSSSKATGGGGNRGRDPRFVITPKTHVFIGGGEGSAVIAPPASPPGPSAATGASTAPTPDARLLQKELRDGFGALVKELRAGGDLGLQIRRNGGL